LGGRGRRTALALGDKVRDKEGIVLLVRPLAGPLRLWLILLIFFLQQSEGWSRGKSKTEKGLETKVAKLWPPDPSPLRGAMHILPPWAREETGPRNKTAGIVLGGGIWGPAQAPSVLPSQRPPFGAWVLQEAGPKALRPNLILQGPTPPPARDGNHVPGCPQPTSSAAPHLGWLFVTFPFGFH
jgi:hypothetical protein